MRERVKSSTQKKYRRYEPRRCESSKNSTSKWRLTSRRYGQRHPWKFVRVILSWAASYKPKREKRVAFFHGRVRTTIYAVPPKDLRKKGKFWKLLKSLHGIRDASQVFATYVEEGLRNHGFQRSAVVPCL